MPSPDKEPLQEMNGLYRDAEGNYRWVYEMDSGSNRSFLKLYLLIFGLIILIPGAVLFLMIYGHRGYLDGAGEYLLIWFGIFAAVELLTVLIYKLIEKVKGGSTDIPYLLSDDYIIVHPDNTRTPKAYLRTDFSSVKDIKLEPDSDLILLCEPLRVTHVYVYPEDLPFVLNYILDRVSQSNRSKELRSRANEMLKKHE